MDWPCWGFPRRSKCEPFYCSAGEKRVTEKKKPVVQITRKGLVVWCALGLFIAGWMFVLGILVGRNTAPVSLDAGRLEQELAELKASIVKKQEAEIEAQASGDVKNKPELGFYEALKKDPAAGKQFKMQPDPVKPPSKPRPAQPEAAQAPVPEKTATPRQPASNATAANRSMPASEKASPGKANADKAAARPDKGKLTIQVAALKEAGGADRLVDSLRKKGYPAYQIQTATKDNEAWYRVRVGAFSARADAQRMLEKLKQDKLKGLIVQTQ